MDVSRRNMLAYAAGMLLPFSSYEARADVPSLVFPADALVESLGVCVHLSYSNTVYGHFDDIIVPLARDLGIRYARDGIPTGPKATPRVWQYVRGREFVENGIKFSCVTVDALYGALRTDYAQLDDAFDWYAQGIDMFEGSNESNLTRKAEWPSAVVEHQRALYAYVKQSKKLQHIPVAGPALFIPGNVPAGDYSDAVDFGNVHAYPGSAHPESTRDGNLEFYIRGAAANTGDKPIIVSETGYHAALETTSGHPPVSEPMIARYLPRLALNCFRKNMRRTFIYELADTYNRGPADKESNFGLARSSGEPKAGYLALRNLIALFNDKGAVVQTRPLRAVLAGDNPTDAYVMVFQRSNREYLLALWLGIPGWNKDLKQTIEPTVRRFKLQLDRSMKIVEITTFDDSGNIKTEKNGATAPEIAVSVSDQLSVLRLVEVS